MKKNCLIIGDLNIDIIFCGLEDKPSHGGEVLSQNYFIDIGGSGGIFASVLSQLGINTTIFSNIGKDYFGQLLLSKLKEFGVNTNQIVVDGKNSTGVTVNIPFNGDKYQISSLSIFRDLDFKKLENTNHFSHLHIPSYYMMRSVNKDYARIVKNIRNHYKDITISLDTNDDPEDRWDVEVFDVISNVDILFLNKKEALRITGVSEIEAALQKLGNCTETVILKLGNKGYLAQTPEGKYAKGSIKTELLDTTGAGDNFDAGFIYGYLNNLSFKDSLEVANICGSGSVEQPGGVGNKKRFLKLKKMINTVNSLKDYREV